MVQRTVSVGSASGLHARSARRVVKAAAELPVPVTLTVAGKRQARADSMLAVLSLGAEKGTEVTVAASDDDPQGAAAVEQLAEMVASDLDAVSPDG